MLTDRKESVRPPRSSLNKERLLMSSSNKPWVAEQFQLQDKEREYQKGIRCISRVECAKKILIDGLKYHEHDGHDIPKRVVRDALKALGVKEEDQPV